MALESVFTRIYAALDSELTGYTLTSDEKSGLVRPVLESEIAEFLGGLTDSVEVTFSFRATEEQHFRRHDNATFDDRLSLTVAGTVCVVETEALDFSDKQLMAAKLSKDAEAGCSAPTFDLCVDADPDDDDAGSFLVADEGHAALAWDTEIPLDIYPTDYLVLRLTLPSGSTGGLRSVRMRLTMLSKALTAKQIWAVSKLAARRYFQKLENLAFKGGDPQTLANLRGKIRDLGAEARGIMGGVPGAVASGGLGGPVNNVNAPANPYWEKT